MLGSVRQCLATHFHIPLQVEQKRAQSRWHQHTALPGALRCPEIPTRALTRPPVSLLSLDLNRHVRYVALKIVAPPPTVEALSQMPLSVKCSGICGTTATVEDDDRTIYTSQRATNERAVSKLKKTVSARVTKIEYSLLGRSRSQNACDHYRSLNYCYCL